tara:strand:- start:377 stop:589 length:213 start_codon:yes stop_codon:yes gene_type:complete
MMRARKMQVGDLIRFSSTGCQGLVIKIRNHDAGEYVHLLCGPDPDGDDVGELAFPKFYLASVAEVINESR